MSPVHKLSQIGSLTGNKIDYPSMLAGYGDFGALQRIGWATFNNNAGGTTFTNIPQTYRDLMVVAYGRDTRAVTAENWLIAINGDTSALYSYTLLEGNGSSAASSRGTASGFAYNFYALTGASAGAGIQGSGIAHILNYTNNSTFKTILARGAADANGSGALGLTVNLYRGTAPVTSLLVQTYENLQAGSTIALYGVKASAA